MTLLVGVVAMVVTNRNVEPWYASLTRPPLTPPNWLFGPVWSVLYLMIAVAAWLVWREQQRRGAALGVDANLRPLRLWGWQLLANSAWTPAFFGLHSPPLGIAAIAALLALGTATTLAFRRVGRLPALLMLPYLAWACYAGYLTAGFAWLNPNG